MAYKIMQKSDDGVPREVKIRGETVFGSDFDPALTELKQFDDGTRSFSAVGSSGLPDRVEDVVDIKGWNFDNFNKNPIGMWAHDYTQLPIFKVSDVELKPRAKKMVFRATFDEHEFADKVYKSYKNNFMKGFSVGFLPLKYEYRDRDEMTDEEKARAGIWGGRYFEKQELLEISAAPIPMHPDALADIKSLGIPTEVMNIGSGNLPKFRSILGDGDYWLPMRDPSQFTNLSISSLGNGIKAVSGKQASDNYESSSVIAKVIGYIFPRSHTEGSMLAWLIGHGINEELAMSMVGEFSGGSKYFELKDEEDTGFVLSLKDGIEEKVEEPEPEIIEEKEIEEPEEVDDNTVEKVVEEDDGLDILVAKSININLDDGFIEIVTNMGTLTLDEERLSKCGIDLRVGEMVSGKFDGIISAITKALDNAGLQEKPVPEPSVQQEKEIVEEEETFDVESVTSALVEIQNETDPEIGVDENLLIKIVDEVLAEQLGDFVEASLRKTMDEASGNLQ